MKNCVHCGAPLDDNARFCHICGASADTARDIAEEKAFLDKTDNILKIERILWLVGAILFLVVTGIYSLLSVMAMMVAPSAGIIVLVIVLVIFLPLVIISFKSASRVSWYRERVYTDPATVLDRIGSVGMIVFAAILNGYAAIPVIINFARTKSCKDLTQRIRDRQNGLI